MHYNTVGLRLKQAGVVSRKRMPPSDIPDNSIIVALSKQGLSQTNIARQLGVSQSFVSKRLKRQHELSLPDADDEGASAPDEGARTTTGKADDESHEQPRSDATGAAKTSADGSAAGTAQDQEAQEKLPPGSEEGTATV